MAAATLLISGPEAERLARELRAAIIKDLGDSASVSQVELDRSAEMVVAVIDLVFSGIATAKTIWDWWRSRNVADTGANVTIVLPDDIELNLKLVDQQQLRLAFEQHIPSAGKDDR